MVLELALECKFNFKISIYFFETSFAASFGKIYWYSFSFLDGLLFIAVDQQVDRIRALI